MTTKEIVISTTSREIADALLSLKIPEARQNEIKMHGEVLEQIFYVGIQYVSYIGVSFFANWLFDLVKKPSNEKTKINDRTIPQNIVDIEIFIMNQIQGDKSEKTTNEKNGEDK